MRVSTDAHRGVTGRLSATFEPGSRGILVRTKSSAALELRGPFLDAVPKFFLRNVTCGIFDRDEYTADLCVKPGTRVRVEPTSATKVYAMHGHGARSRVRLEAMPGSLLQYSSGLTILQQQSCFDQETEIVVHRGAAIAYLELIALGRLASGERLAFRRYTNSMCVRCPSRGLLYEERFELRPDIDGGSLQGALGTAGVIGSLFLLGDGELNPKLPDALGDIYAGASELPNEAGVVVRALGPRAEGIAALFEDAVCDWMAATRSSPKDVAGPDGRHRRNTAEK